MLLPQAWSHYLLHRPPVSDVGQPIGYERFLQINDIAVNLAIHYYVATCPSDFNPSS